MATPITFILGCTGCGKGAVGRSLAKLVGAEIISVDSMKIYRRMDIGTAKPTAAHRAETPHHLIDVAEPSEEFSVAQFARHAESAIEAITARGKHVLAVGGTALYIKALSEGLFEGPSADEQIRERLKSEAQQQGPHALYERLRQVDPEAALRIHPNDLRRTVRALEVYELTGKPISELQSQWGQTHPSYDCTIVGLRRERNEHSERTNQRVRRMIEMGLVDEVKSLLAEPLPLSSTARQALGYAEIIDHLENGVPLDEAIENIKINTRRFSKAQRTWFKRFTQTHWIDLTPETDLNRTAESIANLEGMAWCKTPK